MLKNHFTGINSEGSLLITPHGFINSDDFDKYKKENKESIVEYFKNVLAVHNSENLEIIENEE